MLNQLDDDPFAPDEPASLQVMEQEHHVKLLVVDDDESVHHITKLILQRSEFPGWKPVLLHAMSGREAKEVLGDNYDIAVVLLDVIMESDHAGLDVARFIREDLKNRTTQIIIRTGQPGGKADSGILATHDVNDFRTKSELTSDKLYTCVLAAVRNHQHIRVLESRNARLRTALACLGQLHQSIHAESEQLRRSYSEFLDILTRNDPASGSESKTPPSACFGFWRSTDALPEILAATTPGEAGTDSGNPLPASHAAVLSSLSGDAGWHRDEEGVTGWMRLPNRSDSAFFHITPGASLQQEEEPLVSIALARLCGVPQPDA